jgi:hypothetical protein
MSLYVCPEMTEQATPEAVRRDAASLIVAHGFVRPDMTPRQVRNEIDHLLGGIDPEIKAEVYRKVMDLR